MPNDGSATLASGRKRVTVRPMPSVRRYRDRDLGRVVQLWEREGMVPSGPDGLSVDEAIDLLASPAAEALVAEERDRLIGVALGAVNGPVGTVFRVTGDGAVWDRLLDELEARLAERGARRLVVRVEDETLRERLVDRGFQRLDVADVLQREVPGTVAGPGAVSELGGRSIPAGRWDKLEGMEEPKELIERRVILPLEEPELADRHAVSTPSAILLFGPPGTGKTTFAEGVASRLGWPFVPIAPGRMSDDGSAEEESKLLARTFDQLLELPSGVAFVDEVEEVAAPRDEQANVDRRIANEFLRQIPRLREAPHHVLVCATNAVSRLDQAFLRPGRFDYVLPVGPPDEEARRAIWQRYVSEITDQDVDGDALVEACERFTAADIEFAARKGAQLAFEREYFGQGDGRATTDDFLEAVQHTRPTLTEEMIETFHRDVERFART